MKKAIVFGLGKMYDDYKFYIHNNYDVVALTDNDLQKRCLYQDTETVIEPNHIKEFEFDYVIISAAFLFGDEIRVQLESMGIAANQIIVLTPGVQTSVLGQVYESSGVNILINSLCDCIVFSEVLIWGVYPTPPKDSNYICIDIGLNIGCASLYFASKKNITKVFGFELMPQTYADALKNIALNPEYSHKIDARMYGLGSENKKIFVANSPYSGGNSMYARAGTDLPAVECEVRKCSEVLSEIFKQKQADTKVILKIDCEGAEWEIFDDLESCGLLSCFDMITGELHLYDISEAPKIQVLQNRLSSHGFNFSEWKELAQNENYTFTAIKQ